MTFLKTNNFFADAILPTTTNDGNSSVTDGGCETQLPKIRRIPDLIPITSGRFSSGRFSKYFARPQSIPFRRRSIAVSTQPEDIGPVSGSSDDVENNQNTVNANQSTTTENFDWVKFATEKRLKFEQYVNRKK